MDIVTHYIISCFYFGYKVRYDICSKPYLILIIGKRYTIEVLDLLESAR